MGNLKLMIRVFGCFAVACIAIGIWVFLLAQELDQKVHWYSPKHDAAKAERFQNSFQSLSGFELLISVSLILGGGTAVVLAIKANKRVAEFERECK
ncbi:MAG: hypothetical protein K2X81_24655, partial [Candidatus Obscuribacterales bacterium]|nr:hypothetical protein [Candidatus Obscuribacterales bacterium]